MFLCHGFSGDQNTFPPSHSAGPKILFSTPEEPLPAQLNTYTSFVTLPLADGYELTLGYSQISLRKGSTEC